MRGERQCGNHFISPGRESDDEANEQERDDVSDVNASRCEEHIGAEVVLEDLGSLKHCKYRGLDYWTNKSPHQESSDYGGDCQPRGSSDANAGKLWNSFYRLPPIPSSCESRSRFGREK
jgi:hypothetical protein